MTTYYFTRTDTGVVTYLKITMTASEKASFMAANSALAEITQTTYENWFTNNGFDPNDPMEL